MVGADVAVATSGGVPGTREASGPSTETAARSGDTAPCSSAEAENATAAAIIPAHTETLRFIAWTFLDWIENGPAHAARAPKPKESPGASPPRS
ncbi:hypothetical protein A176_006540 [Myxococcus hansupus]|uniref:Uncharacterized protein n=1 Tax=Pseudomyxococcus hansupus TaxID=1297742 RepID=A0A0H4X6S8_9BACT|nr:hypothetical protein A176_006540 [Myxococcus hansupus]